MKKKVIGGVPGTVLGMITDLCHKLQHGSLTEREFELFLQRQNPFEPINLATWVDFYKRYFGIEIQPEAIRIPARIAGFDRLLVIAKGLTPNKAYAVCEAKFPCGRSVNDLDVATRGRNDREAAESYAIWVRDRVEADKELKRVSANQLKERSINGATLLEREVYELKYFDETGNHLDLVNDTLCSGSRYADGDVPRADWYDGMFWVDWCYPRSSDPRLRARVVVS